MTSRFSPPYPALVSLAAVPLAIVLAKLVVMRPVLGIVLSAVAVGAFLATRSIAYPLGLAGFPAVAIAILGSNPFPRGAAPAIIFTWTAAAAVFTLSRRSSLSVRGISSAPVVLSIALFAYMVARLSSSTSLSYGTFKVELFLINNLTLLVAGIILAQRTSRLDLFLVLVLLVDGVSGFLLLAGIGVDPNSPINRTTLTGENVIAIGIQGGEGLMIAVYLLLHASRRWMRLCAACVLPLSAVAWLASGSRSPVIGAVLGTLTVLAILTSTQARTSRVLLLVTIVLATAAAVDQFVPKQPLHRSLSVLTANKQGVESNGRSGLWAAAYQGFRDHALVGAGTGSFPTIGRAQACPGPGCLDRYPHNIFLEAAVELGIIGLVLVSAFVASSAKAVQRVVKDPATRTPGAIIAGLFVASLVTAMLTGDISGNGRLWLAVGLAVGLGASRRQGPVRAGSDQVVANANAPG